MANVIAIVSFLVGFVLTTTAAAAWCCVLFPGATGQSRVHLETRFVRSLLMGFLVVIGCGASFCLFLICRPWMISKFSEVLGIVTSYLAINRVPNDAMMLAHAVGWGTVCPFLATGLIGLASVAEIFSSKLLDRKQKPFSLASILYGAAFPVMSCCIPIVGWFFIAPLLTLACLGGGLCGIVAMRTGATSAVTVK